MIFIVAILFATGPRSRSWSRPESVVLTAVGVGVGVGKFSSTLTDSGPESESVKALFIISLLVKMETDGSRTLRADCRQPVVYGALIAGAAFISG